MNATRCSAQSSCGGSRRHRLDFGAAEAVGAEHLQGTVGVEYPDRDGNRAEPGPQVLGERADELGAVPRPFGRDDGRRIVG